MVNVTEAARESVERIRYLLGDETDFDEFSFSIKRGSLRAILRTLSAQSAELEALRGEVERLRMQRRWNIERDDDGLLVCFDDHEKGEECEYIRYTSLSSQEATISQLRARNAALEEGLRRVLPYTETERLREEVDVRCGNAHRNPIQKAVDKARALLNQNGEAG